MPEQEELRRQIEHHRVATIDDVIGSFRNVVPVREEIAPGDRHEESARLQEAHRSNQEQLVRQHHLFAALQREIAELRSDNERLRTRREQELDDAMQQETYVRRHIQELDQQAIDTALLVAANDRRIRLFLSSLVGRAIDLIDKHADGPLVALSKFAELLYPADERAKPAAVKAGGIKSWLRSMPETFELHGEGQPGHEQVSLRGSAERPPTVAGLQAAARMLADAAGPSGATPPVRPGSDVASSGETSDAAVKMCMGRAAARRDLATGDTRWMLNEMIHIRDKDPHKHGHNRFIDEATGRRLEERMRAELGKGKKVHRAKSAPRGRPSADARTSGDR